MSATDADRLATVRQEAVEAARRAPLSELVEASQAANDFLLILARAHQVTAANYITAADREELAGALSPLLVLFRNRQAQ